METRPPTPAIARRTVRRRSRAGEGPRGFTLIEIGVVLLVVVLIMVVAIPTLRNVTGMQARTDVAKIAANLRAARGHAAVAGETCRMTFNIAKQSAKGSPTGSAYVLECTQGQATVAKETSHNGNKDSEEKDYRRSGETLEQEKARQALLQRHSFTPSKVLPNQVMTGEAQVVSVWTPHQPEAYTQGEASVYFFPSGTTEPANILVQAGTTYYTIQVTGLGGEVRVIGDKAKLPQEDEDDEF